MGLTAVAKGLCKNVDDHVVTTPHLTTIHFMPLSFPEPAFVVGEADITYHTTFGGDCDYTIICRALATHSDDQAVSELLDTLVAPSGPTSLVEAIESEPTLGGACHDLEVKRVQGRRLYTWGQAEYVGCEIEVYVMGVPNG